MHCGGREISKGMENGKWHCFDLGTDGGNDVLVVICIELVMSVSVSRKSNHRFVQRCVDAVCVVFPKILRCMDKMWAPSLSFLT